MSNYIKNLMGTKGWKEIEGMMNETIINCKNQEIKEELSAEEYKIVHLSNRQTAKNLQVLMNKIRLAGGVLNNEKISYK